MGNKNKKEKLLEELKTLQERIARYEEEEGICISIEDNLKEREIFIKNILDSIQNGISILDKDLNIILVNKTMEKWYSHQMPIIGKKCYEAYHGRIEPCDICPSIRTLKSGIKDVDIVPLTGPKGVQGWLELYTFPLIDFKTGKLLGVIEYVHDISNQKRAEQEIIKAKEEWEKTFNTIQDLIFITDSNGIIKQANIALAKKLNVQPHDLIGKACWEIFRCGRERDESCSIRMIKNGLSVRSHEAEIPFLNMWVLAHVYASYKPSGELDYIIHTYRDITEHKMLEKELLEFYKIEAIARLTGGIAHEFNNLLTGIIGNLGLAESELNPETEEYQYVNRAIKSAERASELVKNLLAFSSKLRVTYKIFSINDEVIKVVNMFKETIDPHIKIDVNTDKDLWTVMADPAQINNILTVLFSNARDAIMECIDNLFEYGCKRDSFVISVETENITIDYEQSKLFPDARPGDFVLITVSDNGPGMDPEIQAKLFEPFFTTREMDKAKGLGLATVYGIVKQHKGWITVSSKLGEGTTFKIYLPRAEAL